MKFIITLALFVVVAVSALPHNKVWPLMPHPIADFSRIVGGSPAELGQFPFMTTVYSETPDGTVFCGGVLIGADWVLTAGICVMNAIRFTIDLGIIDLETSNVRVGASKVFIHPDYVPGSVIDNIALLQLDVSVPFNENIQPVRLDTAFIGAGQNATINGWGTASNAGTSPNRFLNWAVLTTMDNAECNIRYGMIDDGMICCNSVDSMKGICKFDNGGPLVLGEGSSALLIGVISFGYTCIDNRHTVSNRISFYRDWIREVSGV